MYYIYLLRNNTFLASNLKRRTFLDSTFLSKIILYASFFFEQTDIHLFSNSFNSECFFLKKKHTRKKSLQLSIAVFDCISIQIDTTYQFVLNDFSFSDIASFSNNLDSDVLVQHVDTHITNIFLVDLNSKDWVYIWNSLFEYSKSINVEFKIDNLLQSYLQTWYPFTHGFFFVKTTRSNQFFSFGFFKQFLNFSGLFKVSIACIEEKYSDFNLFSENLIRSSSYMYRIDFFKSAGSFGFLKKNKRTFAVVSKVQDYIVLNFIHYITKYNIDFFFFFVKGFFKHIKPIFRTFRKILRKKLKKIGKKAYAFKRLNRILRFKINRHLSYLGVNHNIYLSRIRMFISKSMQLVKLLNNPIPLNKCLVADYETLNTFLINRRSISKYKRYPYIFLSRNWVSKVSNFNPKKTKKNSRSFPNYIQYFNKNDFVVLNEDQVKKCINSKNEPIVLFNLLDLNATDTVPVNNTTQTNINSNTGSVKTGTAPVHKTKDQSDKDKEKINTLIHLINSFSKVKTPNDSSNIKQNPEKTSSKRSKKPIHNTNTESLIKNPITVAEIAATLPKPKPNAFEKPYYVSMLDWKEIIWLRKQYLLSRLKRLYSYIHVSKDNIIDLRTFLKCLITILNLKPKYVSFFHKIRSFLFEILDVVFTTPRSFVIVDLTSYPFNGCRRTRHYHKY